MKDFTNGNVIDNDKAVFYRFNEDERAEQKDEVVLYILTELTDSTPESIMASIKEIKELTGYNLNMETALLIRRFGQRLNYEKDAENVSLKK